MEGIAIGTVVANWEEEHPGMVQVNYLLGPEGQVKTDWISVMTPFGGASYGCYHLPAVGNTVVIGFVIGELNRPVVLGCLWSQDNALPEGAANKDNSKILWKTKAVFKGCVEEKDQEQAVSFSDPEGKNTLVWSIKDKTLTLDVEEKIIIKINNQEMLSVQAGSIAVKGDLAVTVEKNLTLEAAEEWTAKGKNITLQPEQATTVKGSKTAISPSQEVSIKAQTLKLEGTTTELKGNQTKVEGSMLELKAAASGKLSASGILELKGSMVKLN